MKDKFEEHHAFHEHSSWTGGSNIISQPVSIRPSEGWLVYAPVRAAAIINTTATKHAVIAATTRAGPGNFGSNSLDGNVERVEGFFG